MCAAEHAPRDTIRVLERRHGLAEIVERGVGVFVERHRVHRCYPEKPVIRFPESASRHASLWAQKRFDFCVIIYTAKR